MDTISRFSKHRFIESLRDVDKKTLWGLVKEAKGMKSGGAAASSGDANMAM